MTEPRLLFQPLSSEAKEGQVASRKKQASCVTLSAYLW
jgi:hypothetical protein